MSSRWRVPRCEEAHRARRARAWRVRCLAQGPVRPCRTRLVDRGHRRQRGLTRAVGAMSDSRRDPIRRKEASRWRYSSVSLICCDVVGAAAVTAASWSGRSPRRSPPRGLSSAPRRTSSRWCSSTGPAAGRPPTSCGASSLRTRSGAGRQPRLRAIVPGGGGPVRRTAAPRPQRGAGQALRGWHQDLPDVLSVRPATSLVVERSDWGQRADLVLCADDVARGFPGPT